MAKENKVDYKQEFLDIYFDKIERDGADKLLEWLERSDFFTAPASTKHHSSYESGLVEHSVKAYHRFIKVLQSEYGDNWAKTCSEESAAIIALLHDVCKVNLYKVEMRNKKINDKWVQVPYYAVEDSLPYGHGEKSVYIIGGFMKLSREEAMAINWHMGFADPRFSFISPLSTAFTKFPLALLFFISDVEATYLDETRETIDEE